MRCLVPFGLLTLVVAAPANAMAFFDTFLGPPSGFRQEVRYSFVENGVVSAAGTLAGGRIDLFYDVDEGTLQFDAIEFEDSCTAPGTCIAFASATLGFGSNVIRIRLTTPRGFDDCEPLGQVEGFCGRVIATPEFRLEAVLDGLGDGGFVRTASPLTAIPEPASWLSLIGGLALVGAMVRRRRDAGCRVAA